MEQKCGRERELVIVDANGPRGEHRFFAWRRGPDWNPVWHIGVGCVSGSPNSTRASLMVELKVCGWFRS